MAHNRQTTNSRWWRSFGIALVSGLVSVSGFTQTSLSLEQAVSQAIADDLWLVGNTFKQQAMEESSVAAGTLPDPRLGVILANFPTDTFDINQEPMTQVKVDLSQRFPRGNSRQLQRQQLQTLSQQFPWQRQQRRAVLTAKVTALWLDVFNAQTTIALINNDRALFEQLVDVAQASYSSTVGRTRQQDIVRAQLELTHLEDRLAVLQQRQDTSKQQLGEWLNTDLLLSEVDNQIPQLALLSSDVIINDSINLSALTQILQQHPQLRALDKQIQAATTGIELAKQQYKPEWGLTASYAVRDEDLNGIDRSDFFSVGVNFDLPLFTANRQDKRVSATIATAESLKTDKALLMRSMLAQFQKTYVNLHRKIQRQQLYRQQLLPQTHEQAEASLTAYTSDDGDFAEVMRARIAELNANIDALNIDVNIQKHIAELNYFLVGTISDQEKP